MDKKDGIGIFCSNCGETGKQYQLFPFYDTQFCCLCLIVWLLQAIRARTEECRDMALKVEQLEEKLRDLTSTRLKEKDK